MQSAIENGIHQQRGLDLHRKDKTFAPIEITRTVTFNPETSIIILFQDITQRKKMEDDLRQLANYDSLTGLANRVQFNRSLKQAIQNSKNSGTGCSVLLLDLDRFKQINDTLGHDTGDEVLKIIGNRLASMLNEEHIAARLGGDEFSILLHGIDENHINEYSIDMARKLLFEISRPLEAEQYQLIVETSIGIVCCKDGHTDSTTLIKSADIALYEAKSSGRHTYKVFQEAMAVNTQKRANLEHQLKRALDNQELFMEYQPIIGNMDNKFIKLEALLRWRIKTTGKLVSPADFIPIAEQSHIIYEISQYALEEVCKKISEWNTNFPDVKVVVAINLSPTQLINSKIIVQLYKLLRRYNISSESIVLEITETAFINNSEYTLYILSQLRAFGFKLSLDDFGTGYSSLSHLQSMPVNTIKIDKSFVLKLNECEKARALVEAVILIATRFELDVIAEGVEETSQLKILQEMNCHQFQGFLFSRSMGEGKIDEFVKSKSEWLQKNVPPDSILLLGT